MHSELNDNKMVCGQNERKDHQREKQNKEWLCGAKIQKREPVKLSTVQEINGAPHRAKHRLQRQAALI